jgi:hypothetical protein
MVMPGRRRDGELQLFEEKKGMQRRRRKKEKKVLKAIRLRVYPRKEQMKLLQRWFGVCRWTFNKCAAGINNKTVAANSRSMRAAFVNNGNFLQANQWVTEAI